MQKNSIREIILSRDILCFGNKLDFRQMSKVMFIGQEQAIDETIAPSSIAEKEQVELKI